MSALLESSEENGRTVKFYLAPRQVVGGRYMVMHHLGEGTFTSVYKCRRIDSVRTLVALKVFAARSGEAASPLSLEHFRREYQLGARLSHPHILQYYDYFDVAETVAYTMEYAPGGTLDQRIHPAGMISTENLCALGTQICAALQSLHQAGLVHNDLSPYNVYLDAGDRVKLGGLGVARSLCGEAADCCAILGSADYASPEYIISGRLGPQADVYGLGLLLYESMTGRYPFTRTGDPVACMRQRLEKDPVPAASIWPAADPALSALVSKAVCRDPNARPSVEELALGLSGIAQTERVRRAEAAKEKETVRISRLEVGFAPAAPDSRRRETMILPILPPTAHNPYAVPKSTLAAPLGVMCGLLTLMSIGIYYPAYQEEGTEAETVQSAAVEENAPVPFAPPDVEPPVPQPPAAAPETPKPAKILPQDETALFDFLLPEGAAGTSSMGPSTMLPDQDRLFDFAGSGGLLSEAPHADPADPVLSQLDFGGGSS